MSLRKWNEHTPSLGFQAFKCRGDFGEEPRVFHTKIGLPHLAHVSDFKPARLEAAIFADYHLSPGVFVICGYSTFTTVWQPSVRRSRSMQSNSQQLLSWSLRSSISCGTVRHMRASSTRSASMPSRTATPSLTCSILRQHSKIVRQISDST